MTRNISCVAQLFPTAFMNFMNGKGAEKPPDQQALPAGKSIKTLSDNIDRY